MIHAAKVMAATGVDAFRDPVLITRAKADLQDRLGEEGYIDPLPKDAKPPINKMY